MLRNRAVAAAAARDVGQHRDAARVCAGVRRRMDPATYATRSRATVPCAARAVRPPDGDPVVPRSHADASAGHVGAALRLARARAWRLFLLRTPTQRARKMRETSSEGVAQRRHAESSRGTVGAPGGSVVLERCAIPLAKRAHSAKDAREVP